MRNNFIEPTYYPDYDEDVDYLPPAEDEEEEEAPEETQDLYMVTCRTLNVRLGGGTGYARIGTLSRGTLVSGELEDGWLKFSYDGGTAYCSADYLARVDGDLTGLHVTCRTLNVRAGAGHELRDPRHAVPRHGGRDPRRAPRLVRDRIPRRRRLRLRRVHRLSRRRTGGQGWGAEPQGSPPRPCIFSSQNLREALRREEWDSPPGSKNCFFPKFARVPGIRFPLRGALFPPPAEKNGAAARVSAPAGGWEQICISSPDMR